MTVEPDPARAVEAAGLLRPAVVLLDLTAPQVRNAEDQGAGLFRRVARAAHPAPVICLVDRAPDSEPGPRPGPDPAPGAGRERPSMDGRAPGFAEHWIRRPFSPRLLVATVTEALRHDDADGSPDVLRAGAVLVDPQDRSVRVGERPVALTATEFDLLAFLMRGPGRVYTREQLLEAVWGPATSAGARTVDVHVAQLRAKLGPASPLRTVRGVGYAVDE